MKLYQPVKPFHVNQPFGDDKVCTNGKENIMKPSNGTCPDSYESLYKKYGLKGHNGMDLRAVRWQPVYCSAEGTVLHVETEVERGLGVEVLTKDGERYYKHNYWHLIALNVHEGEKVEIGTLLGYADSTGLSTGDHLHWGLKECSKGGFTLNTNNGYKGAIDPAPFMVNAFALDVAPIIRQLKEVMALYIDKLSDMLRG